MKDTKRLFGVQLEESMISQLKKEARSMGMTASSYIRFILIQRNKLFNKNN